MHQVKSKRRGLFFLVLCGLAGLAGLAGSPRIFSRALPQVQTVSAEDLKNAEKNFQKGLAAEKEQDWQVAFAEFSEAVRLYPGHLEYLQHRELARSRLVQKHVNEAERYAAAGMPGEARSEMLVAKSLDPTDSIIQERLRELRSIAPGVPLEEPSDLQHEIHLHHAPGKFSFHIRGDTRSAYEQVVQKFGVEVSFDPELRPQPVRLDVDDLDFASAMRVLGYATGTFYSVTTPKLIFVAQDTAEKRREFDRSVVRTLVLSNSTTPGEMTETERILREMVGLRRVQLDSASRTITLRASPQDAELAAEIVKSLEVPRGELVLEFEILEADRNAASQLGIIPPQSGTIYSLSRAQVEEAQQSVSGLVDVLTQLFGQPSSLAGFSTSQISTLVGAGQLGSAGLVPPLLAFGGGATTFLATLPGASANFSNLLSTVRSGQRILLRAEDGQPATFFVGDRVPVSLAAFSASLGSSQFIPGVSTENFPITTYPTGQGPVGIASDDFNGDGFADLVTTDETANTVSVLLGNGDGTFQTNVDYGTGMGPVAVATGDFNQDGFIDLAVVNQADNTFSILLGNGDGTFQKETAFPTGTMPNAITVGDFNGDGRLDLAITNFTANTVGVFLGNGDGTFQPEVDYATGTGPVSVVSCDFNNDGFLDLAVANQTSNTVSVLLGRGDGTFFNRIDYATGNGPTSVVDTDLNLDGIADLVVANGTDNTVSVLLGNGDGTFGLRTDYATNTDPVALAAADVNIDGLPDIIAADKTANVVSVLINTGSGGLAPPLDLPVGTTPEGIVTNDFNGDSVPDAATANMGSNDVSVILNSSTLQSATGPPVTPFPNAEYQDVGLKIKATPRLHPDGEVTLKLDIELKSLSPQSVNNIPIIQNRTVEQTVRVKENQTSILTGFLDNEETLALSGLPYIQSINGLSQLTTNNSKMLQNTQLLLLITPRLVQEAPHHSQMFYAGHGGGTGGGFFPSPGRVFPPGVPPFGRPPIGAPPVQ